MDRVILRYFSSDIPNYQGALNYLFTNRNERNISLWVLLIVLTFQRILFDPMEWNSTENKYHIDWYIEYVHQFIDRAPFESAVKVNILDRIREEVLNSAMNENASPNQILVLTEPLLSISFNRNPLLLREMEYGHPDFP